jgi:HK97 gp10 family phage protein
MASKGKDITGFKEVMRKMEALDGAVNPKKELTAALRKAIKPAKAAAQMNAPHAAPPYERGDGTESDPYPTKTYKGRLKSPGFGARNVTIVAKSWKNGEGAHVRLGVKKEAYYMTQFVELGTAKTPARPWLEPAFKAASGTMRGAMFKELNRRLDAAAKKKGGKK